MAFPVRPALRGRHRRPHRGRTTGTTAALAGVAVLTAAGAALGATAMASPGHTAASAASVAHSAAVTRAVDVSGSPAHTLAGQAAAQHRAADTAKAKAQAEAQVRAQVRAQVQVAAKAAAAKKAVAEAAAAANAKAAAAAAAAQATAAKAAAATQAAAAAQAPQPAPQPVPQPAPQPAAVSSTAGVEMTAVSLPTASATPAASGYTKPVGDAPIGTPYHTAGSNWASGYHTGVDFLVGPGTAVHAVAAGTVVSAGADGAYGNDVILRHADGKYTLYAHLTQPLVSAGQSVTCGQVIGISGATGNVTGPHLHFEVRTTPSYGSDIDPVAYLGSHGVTI